MIMERSAKTPAIAFAATVCRNISDTALLVMAAVVMEMVSVETSKALLVYAIAVTSAPMLVMRTRTKFLQN